MKTVLVSYEGLALRAAMFQLLSGAGYDVLVAPPSSALAAARLHGAIDMLVTDCEPAKDGGLDLAGRLKIEHPGLRVLYTRGKDAPSGLEVLFRMWAGSAKVVTALASLSAPGAESSSRFCPI